MRVRLVVLMMVLLGCVGMVWAGPVAVPKKGMATYKGAWFEVKYPVGFKVVVREKAGEENEGRSSALGVSFVSPDGLVEFYVFSPQWNGRSEWILRREGEKQTGYSRKRVDDEIITAVTRKGPGYSRSYADYESPELNTRKIFGYKYASEAAYKAYRPLYLKFKGSLVQYAD